MRLISSLVKTLAQFDPPPVAPDPALPPVVLLHGMFSCGDDMERFARHLRSQAREVFQPTLTPIDGFATIEQLAQRLAEFVGGNLGARKFELIGFSMGGLIAQYWLQRLGGLGKVTRFITMGTPHHGTITAWISRRPGWMQMRRDSEFLRDLARDGDALRAIPFTSFYTPLDLIILPARSSEMPQARNVRVWGWLHPSFILEMRCIRAVAAALRD